MQFPFQGLCGCWIAENLVCEMLRVYAKFNIFVNGIVTGNYMPVVTIYY